MSIQMNQSINQFSALQLLENKSFFKIAFVTYSSINLIPIINIQFFTRVFLVFFALWGAAIVGYDLFVRKLRNYKPILLMIAFLAVCLISYLVNFRREGLTNIIRLAFSALSILILFLNDDHSPEHVKWELYRLNLCYSLVTFACVIVSLVFFALNIHFEIIGRIGSTVRFGFLENRLFGVFSSSNIGGSYCFASIAAVLMNRFFLGKDLSKGMKRYYLANLILCYIYIALSLSRGTYLSCSVAIVTVLLLIELPTKLLALFQNKILWARIASIAASLLLFFVGMEIVQVISSVVPVGVYNVKAAVIHIFNPGWSGEEPEVIDFVRIETGKKDVTNGRTDIWKASFSLLKGDLLFGVGSSDINPEDTAYIESNRLTDREVQILDRFNGNSHNGYLQILVECGVFALLLFLAFFVRCFIKWLKSYPRLRQDRGVWQLSVLLLAVVVYFLANNMVETNFMLMGTNTFQCLLWVNAGYLYYLIDRTNSQTNQ